MFLFILILGFVVLVFGGRKTLRGIAHVLSVLLVLPSFCFAGACLFLDHAITKGSTGGFFLFVNTILVFIEVMLPWGTLVFLVCLSALAAAGFHGKWRRAAAGTVGAMALPSACTMMLYTGWPTDPGQWWCYVPGAIALVIARHLFFARSGGSHEFTLEYPGGLHIARGLDEPALWGFDGGTLFTIREMAGGWKWYHLPSFQDGSHRLGIVLGFHRSALEQIDIYHDEPATYEDRPDAGDDREHRRAQATHSWLESKGYRLGSHPWGEIWSNLDARSEFGGIGIRYTPRLESRADAAATASRKPGHPDLLPIS